MRTVFKYVDWLVQAMKLGMMTIMLFLGSALYAQDFKQALLNIQKEYGAVGRMRIVMSIKAFEKKSASTPFYSQKAEIKKDDQNYFYQLGVNDMLLNEKYLLMIDHSAKQIICNKNNIKSMSGFKDPFKMNVDSLLTAYGESSFVGRANERDHYKIIHSKGAIKQTDMYFSVQTNLLTKIEYGYENDQLVVIDFEVFDKQPTFEASEFDESKYMVVTNGTRKPAPAFQQYKIVDSGDRTN
jgi:hypothetical protein